MSSPTPDYLRLVDPAAGESVAEAVLLERICEAFEQAVGWRLEYKKQESIAQKADLMWSAPVDPGVGASLRLVRSNSALSDAALSDDSHSHSAVPLPQAVALAEGVWGLWNEISALRHALRDREAELATNVPVVAREEDPARIAERLEAVLKAGAESVGCQAAGLYLLDADTTSLKLRSCWGLSPRRLLAGPRALRGALADLEALLGHAVVLSDPTMFDYWRSPEPCGAAVCVPVSTATTQLGTLWIFSENPRDFTDAQVNMLEVIAGRLAAELEREVLMADARQKRVERYQLVSAGEQQAEGLPRVAPLIDGWKVAGRMLQNGDVAGSFFDWFSAGQGACALTLGTAVDADFSGALVAAQLRSALRSQAPTLVCCERAIESAHEVLSSLWAGNSGASALVGLLNPSADALHFAGAGSVRAIVCDPAGCHPLAELPGILGTHELPLVSKITVRLNQRSALLVYGMAGIDIEASLWESLARDLQRRIKELQTGGVEAWADLALSVLHANLPSELANRDASLLVIQRT